MQRYIEYFYNIGNFILGNYYNLKSKLFFVDNITDNKQTNTKYLLFKFYFFYYTLAFFKLFPIFIYNYSKNISIIYIIKWILKFIHMIMTELDPLPR